MRRQNTPPDFWAKVDVLGPDDCWLFQGSILDTGYGTFKLAGVQWRAHRLAKTLAHGPIAPELRACHSCDTRYPQGDQTYKRCCNPAHIWPGTDADNQADMTAKGRGRLGARNGSITQPERLKRGADWPKYAKLETIAHGERIANARLTEDQVREIRRLYAAGQGSSPELGRRYQVDHSTILDIVHRRTWAHLD